MSLRFDLVLNCYIREDISDEAIEALRCLTSRDFELKIPLKLLIGDTDIGDMFRDQHFLVSNPENEILSRFWENEAMLLLPRNRITYRWCLQYSGRHIKGDRFHVYHLPFIHWLATVVYEEANQGFIGYMKEANDSPSMLYVKNGELIFTS